MRRRVFQSEARVAALMLALGIIGMPALIWSSLIEERPLLDFCREFYGALVRFESDWFEALVAIFVPLFMFEAVCTFVWAWKNKKSLWHAIKPTRGK
jgi:hypothetical protein